MKLHCHEILFLSFEMFFGGGAEILPGFWGMNHEETEIDNKKCEKSKFVKVAT